MSEDGAEVELLRRLRRAEHRVTNLVGDALRDYRCSLDEWQVLSLLADGDDHSMSEIAQYALMPAPSTTKLVDRLVSLDLVCRWNDSADRRRVLVRLKSKGWERHSSVQSVVEGAFAQLDDALLHDLAQCLLRRLLNGAQGPRRD